MVDLNLKPEIIRGEFQNGLDEIYDGIEEAGGTIYTIYSTNEFVNEGVEYKKMTA